ncbi:MAG: hypothetical protein Q8K75_00295 [Chlamydiales bacterium]|nr:hypothetical protein [Chlamydiales bacterium]
MSTPRLVTLENQQPLQAAKWLKVQVLLDVMEMRTLLETLGDISIYQTGVILPKHQGKVTVDQFLEVYQTYIEMLKRGEVPEDNAFRQMFSSIFTRVLDALYALDLGEDQVIIRPCSPIVQSQLHRLGFSHIDNKFRSMVFGKDSLSWGIQFSYPQLFEDPDSKEIVEVGDEFPNTALFKDLQRWIRHNTLPTPFMVNDERVNIPVRLGKQCFEWINNHPQLAQHQLKIKS